MRGSSNKYFEKVENNRTYRIYLMDNGCELQGDRIMSAIASDGIPIEKGQHLRLTLDGTEITAAWVEPDGCVTDTDGDEWNATDLEHA